jgi:hypothetical protein
MTLSPEERERIYLEEKARHEARAELEQERKQSMSVGSRIAIGCLWALVGLFALIVFGSVCAKMPAGPGSAARPPIDAAQLKSDLENSPRYISLNLLRVVAGVDVGGDQITVVVGSGFAKLDYEDQATAMSTVGSIAGESRGGNDFEIYDLASRKKIGEWSRAGGLRLSAH